MSNQALPEEAPGWAIRLEAKIDVALAQHTAAIQRLTDDVTRHQSQLDNIDQRVDAIERTPFITSKTLGAITAGSLGAGAALVSILAYLS